MIQPLDQRKIRGIQARAAALGGVPVGIVVDNPRDTDGGLLETYVVAWGREHNEDSWRHGVEYVVHQAVFQEDGSCVFAQGDYMIPTLAGALQRMMERGRYV